MDIGQINDLTPGTAHARIDSLETQLALAWVAIVALGVLLLIAGRVAWRVA